MSNSRSTRPPKAALAKTAPQASRGKSAAPHKPDPPAFTPIPIPSPAEKPMRPPNPPTFSPIPLPRPAKERIQRPGPPATLPIPPPSPAQKRARPKKP